MMAVITGLILRKTLLQGKPSPFIMELPPYHLPTLKALLIQTWHRLKSFLLKAGRFIIPVCVLIGALNTLNIHGTLNRHTNQESLLSAAGQAVTPLFAPMGIHQNNWPATVGLLTGVLAKEVVVATLNTLYSQADHSSISSPNQFHFWRGIKAAWVSIPNNILALKNSLGNPILASAPDHSVNQGVLGIMYQRFDGQLGAFTYLLFILLYFPCVSATAATVRELNRRWAVFSMLWTTGLAYSTAVIFYQTATFLRHPMTSTIWIASLSMLLLGTVLAMRYCASEPHKLKHSEKVTC